MHLLCKMRVTSVSTFYNPQTVQIFGLVFWPQAVHLHPLHETTPLQPMRDGKGRQEKGKEGQITRSLRPLTLDLKSGICSHNFIRCEISTWKQRFRRDINLRNSIFGASAICSCLISSRLTVKFHIVPFYTIVLHKTWQFTFDDNRR